MATRIYVTGTARVINRGASAGKWRVGSKRLYQLIPRGLKTRLERERKKRFQAQQREAVTAATAAVADWQRKREGGGTLTAAEEKQGKDPEGPRADP